ncbi:MAG: PIN domain-containing protein [Cytophagales bacterium]
MNLVLDTNILIHLNRGNRSPKAVQVKEFLKTLSDIQVFISVVSIAEAESLVIQWEWKDETVKRLRVNLNKFICINIEPNNEKLIHAYVNIDCYSKRKIQGPDGNLLPNGAITMEKTTYGLQPQPMP